MCASNSDSLVCFHFNWKDFYFNANDYLRNLTPTATCTDKHQKIIFIKYLQFFNLLSFSLV